jgi:DNA-directed RNA polymerase II subunit RPB2
MSALNSSDDLGRRASRQLLHTYFTTQEYPYTRHHIDSFDQFMSKDMISIIRSNSPILLVKDRIEGTSAYSYKVEIFVGGRQNQAISIGTPVVSLQTGEDVRLLFPNEARLRNLTYGAEVHADIDVKITFTSRAPEGGLLSTEKEINIPNVKLMNIPVMLHSRYCLLNGKPKEFLQQAGECPYDHGGYFVVGGREKVLITRQEQAFNTLYISKKDRDPIVHTFATLSSLNPDTRAVKYVAFGFMRKSEVLNVSLPFVRKPINVFILFRAMGVQSDEEIMRLIFPDPASAESKFLADKLIPTIVDAHPFLNTFTAIQYIKTLTKGFGEAHVLDVIRNQLFIHVPDTPGARLNYLADCVRNILKVAYEFAKPTDRDDIRNQRCLTSGFLIQMLFNGIYSRWKKAVVMSIDTEYEYNKRLYSGEAFANIFDVGNKARIFNEGFMGDAITRAFKGKWGSGVGEEKAGVLQSLSRLSYMDFLSHCRRVVLEFDTSMKLTGPRHLHPSQFGYFCTNETPGGASIGITKNMSILTFISTGMQPGTLVDWLRTRGGVAICASVSAEQKQVFVAVTLNNGIIGYTTTPLFLLRILRAFKHTGWLPATVGLGFSYSRRTLFIFTDEGRPLRPLVIIRDGRYPVEQIGRATSWRDLVMGTDPRRAMPLSNSEFTDPLADRERPTFEDYITLLEPHLSVIEYVDPYEHNECFIANFPEQIGPETTHVEVHPSTMMSLMTSVIPYANHNQSPRNQLSCSQSKQAVSIYATNWQNRFDNSGHILCYPEAPLVRTLYYDYAAEGRLGYGQNVILALGMYDGYNQEDGIVFNKDSLERGLFRSSAYRSYEFYEEDDEKSGSKRRIGNPARIAGWMDLKPGLDYTQLDDRGIIRVGAFVDEDVVIVGGYLQVEKGKYKDSSMTPQVWTNGRVESIVVTVNNKGLRLVKIRVVQDRIPELGDKFSNRHGQKGTMGMMFRGRDMPRSASGVIPDVIVNPHSIPSRMTIAQLLEQLFGKLGAMSGSIGDATTFMNEGSTADAIGDVLENTYGFERYGNEILYDGKSGAQIPTAIFVAPVYYMRLKHMVEDKWQARTTGRKEQRTHQPTGGRGKEGGLRFGELERDAVITHGVAGFLRESLMKRSDGTTFPICTGCGTVPIYNERLGISVCPMCQGPLKFAGSTVDTLEMIPPLTKPSAPIVDVEMPYTLKLLDQELTTLMNGGLRFLTSGGGAQHINVPAEAVNKVSRAVAVLADRIIPESLVPEMMPATAPETVVQAEDSLTNLAAMAKRAGMTLVPLDAAIQRDMAAIAAASTPVSAAADLEGLELAPNGELQESVVMPGAMPAPLTVLGSKAPANQLNMVAMPILNAQQQLQAAVGPTIAVNTGLADLRAEGLIEDVGEGGVNAAVSAAISAAAASGPRTLRMKRRVAFTEDEDAPAPPAPARPTGTITINKLG